MNEYVADVIMELADNMGSDLWDTSTTQSRNVLKTISTQLKKIYDAWGITKTSPILKGMSRIDQVIKAIDTALETAIKSRLQEKSVYPSLKLKLKVTTDTTRREALTKPNKKKPPTKKVEPVKTKPTTKVETKEITKETRQKKLETIIDNTHGNINDKTNIEN